MIGVDYYYPTEEQLQLLGKVAMKTRTEKIIYKKIDKDTYRCYCPQCGTEDVVSAKTIKQIKASHLCPFCFREIKSSTQNGKDSNNRFISLDIGKKTFGYYVTYEYNAGEPFKVNATQVYFSCGPEAYHRMVSTGGFGNILSYRPDLTEWKETEHVTYSQYYGINYNIYERLMYDFGYVIEHMKPEMTKKEYLTQNARSIKKSNQKKLVMDNLFNRLQMKFISAFDLKTEEEVMKYSAYMKANKNHIDEVTEPLNVYYLDYLSRNGIDLGKYMTYLHNLKALGMKYDKPKDFDYRYDVIEKMYSDVKDKEVNVQIKKRYTELPRYEKESVTISPFKTAYEIRKCGKVLHNCIGRYVTDYSTKKTDIYHLDLDGAIRIAIEIKENKLTQAYGDENSKCPANLLEHIKSFCNSNGFSLGKYA